MHFIPRRGPAIRQVHSRLQGTAASANYNRDCTEKPTWKWRSRSSRRTREKVAESEREAASSFDLLITETVFERKS